MNARRALAVVGLAICSTFATKVVRAEPYPNKPVRLVIPYTPGAHADLLARTLAQKLSEQWKQPVVVENRPGGGGTIGTLAGARAAPDGYTLLMSASGQIVIYPAMMEKPPYNAITDFEPVAPLVRTPWVLYINKDIPAKNVQEFVAYARSKPGGLNGATPGVGTTVHLANALFMRDADFKAEHVHYNGSAQAVQDLIAGRNQFMFDSMLTLRFVPDGQLRALAVSSANRSPFAPDLPTMMESGMKDFDVTVWFGLFMPAKTPADIVARVNADVRQAMSSKDLQDRLAIAKFEYIHQQSPAEFKAFVHQDTERWTKVVREIGIKAD